MRKEMDEAVMGARRWIVTAAVVGGVGLIGLGVGCSTSHERLTKVEADSVPDAAVQVTPESPASVDQLDLSTLGLEAAEAESSVEPTSAEQPIESSVEESQVQVPDSLHPDAELDPRSALLVEAESALDAGDFEAAQTLLELVLREEPDLEAAISLQARLDEARQHTEREAARDLIAFCQREGARLLARHEFDAALAYLLTAQDLDPTSRKTFILIQRTYARQRQAEADKREDQFRQRLRLARLAKRAEQLAEATDEGPSAHARLAPLVIRPTGLAAFAAGAMTPASASSAPAAELLSASVAMTQEAATTPGELPVGPAETAPTAAREAATFTPFENGSLTWFTQVPVDLASSAPPAAAPAPASLQPIDPAQPVTMAQAKVAEPAPLEVAPALASPLIPQIVPSGEAAGYTVQPGDVLQITVYEEPALTTKARAASSGEIMFPLLGRVAIVGLTVPQVQEKLTSLLGEDYLVNPQLQVSIESYQLRNVFITGAVNRPGSYSMPAEKLTTLLEAIAMAGGFSDDASLNGTRIIRIEDGQKRTITVRAGDIIKKGDKAKDTPLRPNDVIFVPESFF